jgi:hypothetical protein
MRLILISVDGEGKENSGSGENGDNRVNGWTK